MIQWKWFQVAGGHNLDSLYLTDYFFTNRALRNELRSHKDPVTWKDPALRGSPAGVL